MSIDAALSRERLEILAQLPMLLNASLEIHQIIQVAIQHLRRSLNVEAATVFLVSDQGRELEFWALEGGDSKLSGFRVPIDKGIVGACIAEGRTVRVDDVSRDERFFTSVDQKSGFQTVGVLCTPLFGRAGAAIGAIEVLNPHAPEGFCDTDLLFIERIAPLIALSIENSKLVSTLQTERKQLQALQSRRDEMLDVVTHEIRTPLNVVQSASELLASSIELEPADREEMRKTLLKGVRRVTTLIQSLRQAVATKLPELPLDSRAVDLQVLIAELHRELSAPLATRHLTFKIVASNTNTSVQGDRELLRIALRNLLANAIRFTADGGSISVHLEEDLGLMKVSVIDTGIGIPAEHQRAIFEKFYEVGSAMTHSSGTYEFKSGGLGLGLPTVQAIVTAHRGELTVSSVPGKGSRFTISLPLVC
jgi:K+-sensing histidine kinase KdpD